MRYVVVPEVYICFQRYWRSDSTTQMLASYPSNTTADVYVWSSNHCTAHATPEDSDSDTWMLATPLPLKEPGPSSEGMDTDSTSSSPEPAEFTSDHEESQGQMDLFRKLGFSAAQVRAVRHKLGLNADTNTVLGELVLAGVEQEEKNCSGLVPRGESPHEPHVSLPHAPVAWASTQEERSVDGDALKSIVIDGSNVAMRWVHSRCPCMVVPTRLPACGGHVE